MANNNGGPWGGAAATGGGGDDDDRNNGGGRRPGDGPQIPEIDEIVKKGQEQLRVLMGGRGGGNRGNGTGGGGGGVRVHPWHRDHLALLGAVALWLFASLLHGETRRTVGRTVPGQLLQRSAIPA